MTSLSSAWESTLIGILEFATCIWIGGVATVIMAVISSAKTLDSPARVAFFRRFGRTFGIVATVALVVILVVGGVLLGFAPWTALSSVIVVLAVLLVVFLAWGIVQAMHMTRLRRAAEESADETLQAKVARRSIAASSLRGLITLLSLALFVVFIVWAG